MKAPALALVLLAICLSTGFGQSPDEPNRGPVQAEFLKHINVRHFAPGETVLAQVTLDWSGPDCVLHRGAILEARVEAAELHKLRASSRLALAFTRAQCNGTEMTPFNLVLAAVADAPLDWKTVPDSQVRMPMSFSNPHPAGMSAGIGGAGAGDLYDMHLELMGVIHRFPMNAGVRPGDVIGIKGVKLEIGTGPDRSSVLSAKDRDVTLGAFTQMLLVPASVAFQPTKVNLAPKRPAPVADPGARPSSPAAPVNTLEVCAPPGCAVDLPVTANELQGHNSASIAIGPLGYARRSRRILQTLNDEEALAWLGPDQLLFAFNPHPLIHRAGVRAGTARIVRAVLLDARTRAMVRAVDWEIANDHRFLWQLDGTRILAHIGNELRVYGPGLDVQHTIPLAGPLAFVRIAPNGELLAVATLRERHSPELHARMRLELGSEPEEDVDVAILDQSFKVMASAATVSGLMPPTLLNEGQVKLLARPKLGYRLAMSTWQNSSTTLARFDSICTPQLSSVAPDLIFLLSCNAQKGDAEYRMLRPDGKLLLRGASAPGQIGQEAVGNGRAFAIKLVNASTPLTPGADFTALDLDSEEVRVYRAEDGKRLLSVRVSDPATSYGSYALSPDGSQLAVLSASEIRLFAVPADPGSDHR
ncbi:MAG TPA: hypothetical protein VG225_14860 [Terracidiphilus sp.]|jgi:hypothetical protein|nr:hypothetical protein [Terracidiphilus sp.]